MSGARLKGDRGGKLASGWGIKMGPSWKGITVKDRTNRQQKKQKTKKKKKINRTRLQTSKNWEDNAGQKNVGNSHLPQGSNSSRILAPSGGKIFFLKCTNSLSLHHHLSARKSPAQRWNVGRGSSRRILIEGKTRFSRIIS